MSVVRCTVVEVLAVDWLAMRFDRRAIRLAHALYRLWRLRLYTRRIQRRRRIFGPLPAPKYPPRPPSGRPIGEEAAQTILAAAVAGDANARRVVEAASRVINSGEPQIVEVAGRRYLIQKPR